MAQLAQDTFTRGNTTASTTIATGLGTASDGETWTLPLGAATFSIASNEGHITGCTAATFARLGSTTSANAEALVRVQTSATTSTRAGIALRQTATNTFYIARMSANNSSIGISISKTITGTNTDLFTASFTVSLSTYYWIRFRVVGTSLFAKIWASGSGEPSTWTVSGTDTAITGAGGYGLTINASSGTTTWDFDSFTITDGVGYHDTASRFRLVKANDAVSRFRLLATKSVDALARFRMQSSTTTHDALARFRQQSATQNKDAPTRLRLGTGFTAFLANAASTTIATANQLYGSGAGSPSTTQTITVLSTATGYGELLPRGGIAWAASGSIGSPTGLGYFYDANTLGGQQFVSGTWQATVRLVAMQGAAQGGTLTGDLYVRAYKYTPASATYTLIASTSLTGQTINASLANYTTNAVSASAITFLTSDRLYIDTWVNVTANSNGLTTQGIRINRLTTDTVTFVGDALAELTTPGYIQSLTPSRLLDALARFRQQSGVLPHDALARFRVQSGTTLHDAVSRFGLAASLINKDAASRFRLLATKSVDALTRFRLQSGTTYHDAHARFRQQSGVTNHDAAARFRQLATATRDGLTRFRVQSGTTTHDGLTRFRQQSAVQRKDTASRLRLQSGATYHDAVSRFRLTVPGLTSLDVHTRFRLLAQTSVNLASRFRLQSATLFKDTSGRFRVQSGVLNHDASSRFRVQSGTTTHDTASRFRVSSPPVFLLVAARFRLQVTLLRDASTRFRQQSGVLPHDARTRFRVLAGPFALDAHTRFRQVAAVSQSATGRFRQRSQPGYQDAHTRFRLSITSATSRDAGGRFGLIAGTHSTLTVTAPRGTMTLIAPRGTVTLEAV